LLYTAKRICFTHGCLLLHACHLAIEPARDCSERRADAPIRVNLPAEMASGLRRTKQRDLQGLGWSTRGVSGANALCRPENMLDLRPSCSAFPATQTFAHTAGESNARCERFLSQCRVRVYLSVDSNGFVESFHGKLRDECLNREWFASLAEAVVVIEQWRQFYNAKRPHSSLNYMTPSAFAAHQAAASAAKFSTAR
jgi:Integrase core domain